MKHTLRTSISAIALVATFAAPLATLTIISIPDTAIAKSENAGGNGKSNKGGNSSAAKSQGKGNSSAKGGNGNGLAGLFGKFGTNSESKGNAKVKVSKSDPMHPSNLGNMNGALNANINAVLAHIRNGNTNGPVGLMAALAQANYNAIGAQDIVDLEETFVALEEALEAAGFDSVTEYYLARIGIPGIPAISEIDEADPTDQNQLAIDNGFASYDEYLAMVAGTPGIVADPTIDPLIEALDGDPIGFVPPLTADDLADAQAALDEQDEAENSILDFWNKDGDGDLLLIALNDHLDEYEPQIGETIEEMNAALLPEDCDPEDLECIAPAEE